MSWRERGRGTPCACGMRMVVGWGEMRTPPPMRRERGKPLLRACRHQLTKPSDPPPTAVQPSGAGWGWGIYRCPGKAGGMWGRGCRGEKEVGREEGGRWRVVDGHGEKSDRAAWSGVPGGCGEMTRDDGG
eukprot:scaffold6448_cov124-Isochrysis_galbana.AAC.10